MDLGEVDCTANQTKLQLIDQLFLGYCIIDVEMAKRDHFDVLIVCPQESELQAARHVFEHETKSKFEGAHTDLPYNLTIHMDRQTDRQKHI